MKYSFFLVVLSLLISKSIFSQKDSLNIAHNVIFIEVAGAGAYGSVTYERVLYNKKLLMFTTRLGISTYHINDFTNNFNPDILLPISINGCYGNNNKIEFGIGQTFASIVHADITDYEPKRITNFHTIFSIGYRYQKDTKGIFFRCVYTPIIEFNSSFRNWAGISVGYSF